LPQQKQKKRKPPQWKSNYAGPSLINSAEQKKLCEPYYEGKNVLTQRQNARPSVEHNLREADGSFYLRQLPAVVSVFSKKVHDLNWKIITFSKR
jgi:hypothetical protein